MEQHENQIILRGDLLGLPEFSHENHGRRFCRFLLEIPRLSGAVDTLPVIAGQERLSELPLSPGRRLTVRGQIRSHNQTDATGRHLMIFVFASELFPEDGEPVNEAAVSGLLCREPTFRRTPLGREICDAMLAVPRAFRRADYLPCILWGRTAQEISRCHTRDRIEIQGRLQSRIYTKYVGDVPVERTAYELSALTARAFAAG
ncbi:MAG: single-stranded DNA-binding protein [Oscillospiraceae bacterium]|nr:single-stranded DNA-binding protein [Oscillospiraceae bacterium]